MKTLKIKLIKVSHVNSLHYIRNLHFVLNEQKFIIDPQVEILNSSSFFCPSSLSYVSLKSQMVAYLSF